MNLRKFLRPMAMVAAMVLVLATAGSLFAATITGFNTRPVTIVNSGEPTVQNILDSTFGPGVINATTGQQSAGVFQTAGIPPGGAQSYPTLLAEFSSLAAIQTFGMWTATDTAGPITTAQIFNGPAAPFDSAQITWTGPNFGTVTLGANPPTAFAGIPYNWFGFYYSYLWPGEQTVTTLFSYDALNQPQLVGDNNHTAAILAYKTPTGSSWAFFCDDLRVEPDYNDMVVKVESIDQVPVPPSVLLLGSGLLGLGAIGFRRRKS